jgi:phosphatidylglycerophosphate synthase
MMRNIPKALIYSRMVLGFSILAISLFGIECSKSVPITLLTLGLLSDVFDGIIARRLNVSNESLRRLDSTVDQVFWVLVAVSVFITYPDFFYTHWVKLLVLICVESMPYIISFARFRKEVATHAITSKIWALVLFATLIELMNHGDSVVLFEVCFYVGVITRAEIILILLVLRNWANDVPSLYHAVRLRQGKPIRRNKLLNG